MPPDLQVRFRNNGPRRLYVAPVDLTELFKISAVLQDTGAVPVDPGQEAWAYWSRPIPATVPDAIWQQGVVEYRDILKVVICTDDFDARLMEQPALGLPRATRSVRRSALDHLMKKVQTRDLGDDPATDPDDWTTQTVVFTTVRPQESAPVPTAGPSPRNL